MALKPMQIFIAILIVFIIWMFLFPLEVFGLLDTLFQWINPESDDPNTATADTPDADPDADPDLNLDLTSLDFGKQTQRITQIVQTILSILWLFVFMIFAMVLINALLYAKTKSADGEMLQTIRAIASLIFIVFLIRTLLKETYTEFQFNILHTNVKTLKHNIYDSTSLMTRAASMMYLYTLFYIKLIWFLFIIYCALYLFKYFTKARLLFFGLKNDFKINKNVRTVLDVHTWFASLTPSQLKMHGIIYLIGLISIAVYSIIFLKKSSRVCTSDRSKSNEIATANRATYGFAMVYSMMTYYYLILAMLILFNGIMKYKWGVFMFSKAP